MRPVEKWKAGTCHQLNDDDGSWVVVQKEYATNKLARPVLSANLGLFCSYCENSLHEQDALEVEHVEPKSRKKTLERKLTNFLLSCPACNRHKSGKRVILKNIHFPHRNNTYKSLVYNEAGGVLPNHTLPHSSIERAHRLIRLVALDNQSKINMRRRTWQMAIDAREDYRENDENYINNLMKLIESRGGWSIWFTVFKGYDDVRKRLIEDFPGTAADCFDPNNHYEPIDRNPGKADPV